MMILHYLVYFNIYIIKYSNQIQMSVPANFEKLLQKKRETKRGIAKAKKLKKKQRKQTRHILNQMLRKHAQEEGNRKRREQNQRDQLRKKLQKKEEKEREELHQGMLDGCKTLRELCSGKTNRKQVGEILRKMGVFPEGYEKIPGGKVGRYPVSVHPLIAKIEMVESSTASCSNTAWSPTTPLRTTPGYVYW